MGKELDKSEIRYGSGYKAGHLTLVQLHTSGFPSWRRATWDPCSYNLCVCVCVWMEVEKLYVSERHSRVPITTPQSGFNYLWRVHVGSQQDTARFLTTYTLNLSLIHTQTHTHTHLRTRWLTHRRGEINSLYDQGASLELAASLGGCYLKVCCRLVCKFCFAYY